MKIAVSATGTDLDAMVDPRFGRCQYFVYVDPETLQFEASENTSASAGGGAGISTAQSVAEKGVEVILTGNCGPNAYQVLNTAGIKVITGVSGKVRDAIEAYKSDKLQTSSEPNVSDHFGMGGRGGGGGGGGGRGGMGFGRGPGRA
ncbi:MAG: NifB/NifX family molybdenum-iron cluster-binding protein [Dehalococcoidales bacterium]|nr:NifB/NifX family molybdenum-iron cluster-binding protein [Dehalococcoidales bacterium]